MISAELQGDAAVVARFAAMGPKLRQALVDAMRRQWFRVQAEVVTGKLSGDPLHRRTGNLASSINVGGPDTATAFEEGPAEIVGRIGTKVRYGAIHENGGTVQVPAHTRTITQAFGRPITPREAFVRAHPARFPQRSFLRSTLAEMHDSVLAEIERAIADATAEV